VILFRIKVILFVCIFVVDKVPEDWDLVKTSDVRKMSPTHSLLTTSNMIIGSLSKTVSSVTKAIGSYMSCSECTHTHAHMNIVYQ